uniref:FBA_2 domain-containing protein n=1 Tax=Caenorhabditis tropicalis TaxID=1561998 RepID=A0A1I7TTT5_9PELO
MTSTNSSGGLYSETLYNIASQTNGFCSFDTDDEIIMGLAQSPAFYNPYLLYAVNPTVSGKGPMNVLKKCLLSWTYNGTNGQVGLSDGNEWGQNFGNSYVSWPYVQDVLYNMTLDYEYLDSKTRTLQIRIRQDNSTTLDYWPPYDN